MLVRCNTDLGAELFRSSYLTFSVRHYGCTEETSNGTARTITGSSKVPVQPGPGGNTRSRREGATEGPQKRKRREDAGGCEREGYGRVPVEFRPSIGRCPLQRSATGTILSKALSHIGRSSVGARPVSVKKTSFSGCLRCTGHRPILGRAPANVFSRSLVGARPVSVKKTSSSGCLRCTGHRPILGRAPADVFSDVVTMGLR